MRDARNLGVEPVQFNVVGASELQVKPGLARSRRAVRRGARDDSVRRIDRQHRVSRRGVDPLR